jgi:hypothetical protein
MVNAVDKLPGFPSFVRSLRAFKSALIVAIILSARFAWLLNHAEKWDTPSAVPLVFLCELPLAIALIALRSGSARERAVRSAGIAFGAALTFAVIIPPLLFLTMMSIWEFAGTYRGLVAFEKFLPVCLISALWLLVCAFSQRNDNRHAFLKSAGVGVACIVFALALMAAASVPGSAEVKSKKAHQSAAFSGEMHVRAVAACLIRHQFLHPEQGFPSSLSNIGSEWNCDPKLADPWAFPGYWMLYSVVIDPSSHRAVDFRVQAIPLERGEWAAADRRGEVLQFTSVGENAVRKKPVNTSGRPYVMAVDPHEILPVVYDVQNSVREYMRAHDPTRAPSSLAGLFERQQSGSFCDNDDPKQRLVEAETGRVCDKIDYFPPASESADSFAVSVACTSYGQECIRSYFLDYEGTVHATSEPRAATARDPILLPCETVQVCDDPVWTPDAQPSGWTVFKANFLYSIHSI